MEFLGDVIMFSWEIDNYLKERDYKLTFTETRNIMISSPQIFHWKLEQLQSDIQGCGKYSWRTTDDFQWFFFIENDK